MNNAFPSCAEVLFIAEKTKKDKKIRASFLPIGLQGIIVAIDSKKNVDKIRYSAAKISQEVNKITLGLTFF